MISINKIRTYLYSTSKILGDINAVQKGKIIRRIFRRITGGWAGKILRFLVK